VISIRWILLLLLVVGCPTAALAASEPTWIFFTDKGLDDEALLDALDLRRTELSDRTLRRRLRVRAQPVVDARDLAVHAPYLERVTATGVEVRATSRWLNAVSVVGNERQLQLIRQLTCVEHTQPVARRQREELRESGAVASGAGRPYGLSEDQLFLLGVPSLHDCGLTGAGVVVGVQDTGFDLGHDALAHVDVLAQWDFINDDPNTFDEGDDPEGQQNHGTSVLSLVAGWDEGTYSGVAPDVTVLLSKTEDTSQEEPIEEDWWVEGIEWIEGEGADLMTASLGYFDWYEPEDMDGQTAVTTLAATTALDNGLILVNSAGNEGPEPSTIIAPADAEGLIAVGAVDIYGHLSDFSSRGPTADGRIKPDVCGMGVSNWVVQPGTASEYKQGSGTSYAAPMVAGMVALLLQAFPDLGPEQMRDLLTSTASIAEAPDNDYGWGVVSGVAAVGLYCTCQDYDEDGVYNADCGGSDCDDFRAEIYPGAEEVCDGFDDDCDGELGEGEADEDRDGWLACGEGDYRGDCDDLDALTHPGAPEIPYDGIDQDCDGDDLTDLDGDGHDGPSLDCNDQDPDIHPDRSEVCDDRVDNDCDGLADELDPECIVPWGSPVLVDPGDDCLCRQTTSSRPAALLACVVLGIWARIRRSRT
jgi:hypothetical protein